MYFSKAELRNLTEEKIKSFLERRIAENHHLDYKENLDDSPVRMKREFLKDVTSFANANGGDIIIGVKDPEVNNSIAIDELMTGIDNGRELVNTLENVARDCIDPRVSGFEPILTPLSNNKHVIIIHIPPSLGKPHIASIEGKTLLYIRHHEHSDPMTSFELKQTVLSSVTAEAQANDYLNKMAREAIYTYIKDAPSFLLQAMPIIPPESPLDVLTDEVNGVLVDRGGHRGQSYPYFSLLSYAAPSPTIHGITGKDSRTDIKYIHNFHKNGYVGLSFKNLYTTKRTTDGTRDYPCLNKTYENLFKSFLDMTENLLKVVSFESPYLLRCKYLNARDTTLEGGLEFGAYPLPDIEWPDQIRQTGESFLPFADVWLEQMFHAFGTTSDNFG